MGNKNFPTGHFRLSSWIYTEIQFCKKFSWARNERWAVSDERWAVSTQMSSWTRFRICPRRRTRKGSRWDAETSSAWHLESFVICTLILGKPIQYLCLVQKLTAHCSLLIAHNSKSAVICRICVICVLLKILYKTVFLCKSSWKVESAQLENFYFPTGKLFFLSWKIKISQ